MARTATKEKSGKNAYGDESTAGYFRKVFAEDQKLLKGRSNAKLLERWLDDHPGYKEVPNDVKSSLANLKSVLRHKKRKRKKAKMGEAAVVAVAVPQSSKKMNQALEILEEQIDECYMLAKSLAEADIDHVIGHLRSARNAVVWRQGQ